MSKVWQNKNKAIIHDSRYGITNNTAFYNVDLHQLHPTEPIKDNHPQLYLSLSTFDGEFIILSYENQIGKLSSAHKIAMKEIVRVKTNFPIAKCHLEYRYKKGLHKDALIGYLIDIYSNIYTVNFSVYIEHIKTIGVQPVKYIEIFNNTQYILKKYRKNQKTDLDNIDRETPLFVFKDNVKDHNALLTLNIDGEIKIIKDNFEKSYVKATEEYDVDYFAFKESVLAATCNYWEEGYLMAVAFNNGKTPYLFVNCENVSDFRQQFQHQNASDYQENTQEISYLAFDKVTNNVIVAYASQKVQFYLVKADKSHKKGASQKKEYYLKRLYGFCMSSNLQFSSLNKDFNIEHIQTINGILMITTCKQFTIYDIKQRIIKKKINNSSLSHFRFGKILDINEQYFSCVLIKGFNHINQNQSKVGKPNIHLVLYEFNKNKLKIG